MAFGTYDWVVLGVMLGISLLISIISKAVRHKKEGENEFLMGSRTVPLVPTAVSLMASFLSSILILGYPADTFQNGPHFFVFVIGEVIGGVLTLVFLVPLFYPLKLTSVYEYIELRFESKPLRIFCSLVGMAYQLIYVGVCIYGPCVTFSFYTGFDTWKAILILGAIGTIPTAIGGLRGVIWMDLFQSLVMYGTILAILVVGTIEIGSYTKAWETFIDNQRSISFETSPRETWTLWSALIGGLTVWVGHFGVSQSSVQRYSSLPSYKLSLIGVALGNFITLIGFIIACMCGVVLYSYYLLKGCNPLDSDDVKTPNHLLPFFLGDILDYPAIPGLFVAALAAGGFSSMTSSLTSIAANFWSDILSGCCSGASDTAKSVIPRVIVFVGGIMGTAVAYAVIGAGGTVVRLISAFINAMTGPLVGVFLLGSVSKIPEKIGTFIGVILGLGFNLWLAIGSYMHVVPNRTRPPGNFNMTDCFNSSAATNTTRLGPLTTLTPITTTPEPDADLLTQFYEISPYWYGCYGILITFTFGFIISLCVNRCGSSDVPNRLLLSCFGYRCRRPLSTSATKYASNNQGFHALQKTRVPEAYIGDPPDIRSDDDDADMVLADHKL